MTTCFTRKYYVPSRGFQFVNFTPVDELGTNQDSSGYNWTFTLQLVWVFVPHEALLFTGWAWQGYLSSSITATCFSQVAPDEEWTSLQFGSFYDQP